MTLRVSYVEESRPVKAVTLSQPKGSLDLTLVKNHDGKRIRISNRDGNVINVDTSKLADFKKAIDEVFAKGVKTSQRGY